MAPCSSRDHDHIEATHEVRLPAANNEWVPYCTSCTERMVNRDHYDVRSLELEPTT